LLAEKVSNERGDQRTVLFQSEVARVEQVELHVLQVTPVGVSPGGRENRVVLSPDDQSRRLVLAEVFLPLWIEGRIAAIAVEQRQLNLLVSWPVQERLHMSPSVGTDGFGVANTMEVLPFGRIEIQQRAQAIALLLAAIFPIGFDRLPKLVVDAFVVGVAVLHDQRLDTLRVLHQRR